MFTTQKTKEPSDPNLLAQLFLLFPSFFSPQFLRFLGLRFKPKLIFAFVVLVKVRCDKKFLMESKNLSVTIITSSSIPSFLWFIQAKAHYPAGSTYLHKRALAELLERKFRKHVVVVQPLFKTHVRNTDTSKAILMKLEPRTALALEPTT